MSSGESRPPDYALQAMALKEYIHLVFRGGGFRSGGYPTTEHTRSSKTRFSASYSVAKHPQGIRFMTPFDQQHKVYPPCENNEKASPNYVVSVHRHGPMFCARVSEARSYQVEKHAR